ncbi:hypothetical protein ABPG74_005913 [Tetrahymena malaccensis]
MQLSRKDIIQKIKDTWASFSKPEIILLLDSLEKNKPNLEIIVDSLQKRRLITLKNESKLFYQESEINCLQMKVFDKEEQKRKCIEVFSQDQQGEIFELIVELSQQSKWIARKEFILNVLNSYYIDDYMIFYVIEYEDFDVSTNCLYGFLNLRLSGEIDIELKQYLDSIYQHLKLAICPYSQFQQRNIQIDICQEGFFAFQKFNDQYKIKLNIIDPLLFQLKSQDKHKENSKEHTSIKIYQEKLFKVPNNFILKQKLFIESIRQNYPRIIEKFQESILYVTKNESYSYSILKFNEKDEIVSLLQLSDNNQRTLIDIQRYESHEEGRQQLQKYLLLKKELDEYSLQTNADFELQNLPQGTYFIYKFHSNLGNCIQNANELFQESSNIFNRTSQKQIISMMKKAHFLIKQLILDSKFLFKYQIEPQNIYLSGDKLAISGNIYQHSLFNDTVNNQNKLFEQYTELCCNLIQYCQQNPLFFSQRYSLFGQLIMQYFFSVFENKETNQQLFSKLSIQLDTAYKSIELNQKFQQQIFTLSNHNIHDLTCIVYLNKQILQLVINQIETNNFKEEALIITELNFQLEPLYREQNELDRRNKSICYCNFKNQNFGASFNQFQNNSNQPILTNQEDQPDCISHESNQLAIKLSNKFSNLKRLHIVFCYCRIVKYYMNKQPDYFSLTNRQNLIYLEITIVDEESQIEIYKQLKQNKNQINTLIINKKDNFYINNPFKVSKVLKKLKYIVQLK